MKIGYGIFTWSAPERRSNRYGSFNLVSNPFSGPPMLTPTFDAEAAEALQGQRVKLTCVVVDTRQSGHLGDAFLGIAPSTPAVGEVIVLGVGVLQTQPCEFDQEVTNYVLEPGDGRPELWMDPRKLYRLHEQTVEVYAEATDQDFSPAPVLEAQEGGMISNGDGSLQVKQVDLNSRLRVKPKIERVGDGLFVMTPAGKAPAGERVEFDHDAPPTAWDRINESD